MEARETLFQQGTLPRVLMKDEFIPRALHLPCQKGLCQIHILPEKAADFEAWVNKLNVKGLSYRGEGLPSLARKVLFALIQQKERTYPRKELKAELLEKHGFKCASCKTSARKFEWDHVHRLCDSVGNAPMWQPLCKDCHAEKTRLEPNGSGDLASCCCPQVWSNYVKSKRLPPLVHKLREISPDKLHQLELVDVIRCRRNAMAQNVYPIPILCPFDDIKPKAKPELADLNYITQKFTNVVTQLGYTGPGWYHRVQAEWLLHIGVITWDQITHVLEATGHAPLWNFQRSSRQDGHVFRREHTRRQTLHQRPDRFALN